MLNFAFNTRQKSIKQSQALNTTGTRGGQNTEVQFKTECPPEKKTKKNKSDFSDNQIGNLNYEF